MQSDFRYSSKSRTSAVGHISGGSGGTQKPPTSINDVIISNGVESPACWNWGIKEIEAYVIEREEICSKSGMEDSLKATISDVAYSIIIHCLQQRIPYRIDKQNIPEPIYVSFYNCDELPISDVFSALGWFISMADPRSEGHEVGCLSDHFRRLVHYTRLCYTISTRVRCSLAKTHLLLSVGLPSVVMLNATITEMASLSSSLPKSRGKGGKDQKDVARFHRAEFGRRPGNSNRYDQFADDNSIAVEGGGQKLGHCAETLTILSQMRFRSWSYVWGTALDVEKVGKKFIGYEPDAYMLSESGKSGHTPPCKNCRVFFRRGNVTFMDILHRKIQGPLPEGYTLEENWNALIPCQKCGEFIPKEVILDPEGDIEQCQYGCESYWCGKLLRDGTRCSQGKDKTHDLYCVKHPDVPGLPDANPLYLPAVAGEPPAHLLQQFQYVPTSILNARPGPLPTSPPSNPMAPGMSSIPSASSSWGPRRPQMPGPSQSADPFQLATNMASLNLGTPQRHQSTLGFPTNFSQGTFSSPPTQMNARDMVPGSSSSHRVPDGGVPVFEEPNASGQPAGHWQSSNTSYGNTYGTHGPRFQPGNPYQYYGQ